MAANSRKAVKSYMKPVAKRVTIQRPERKAKVDPADSLPGGFTRINEWTIRKVYK
jgi:hypothetical protein